MVTASMRRSGSRRIRRSDAGAGAHRVVEIETSFLVMATRRHADYIVDLDSRRRARIDCTDAGVELHRHRRMAPVRGNTNRGAGKRLSLTSTASAHCQNLDSGSCATGPGRLIADQ